MCAQSLVVPGGKLIRVKGRSGPKEAKTPPRHLFSAIYGIFLAMGMQTTHGALKLRNGSTLSVLGALAHSQVSMALFGLVCGSTLPKTPLKGDFFVYSAVQH